MDMIDVNAIEGFAKQTLDKAFFDYVASGADDELTLRRNSEAFKKILIIPRVLRDVSKINTEVTILGHHLSMPLLIGPTAFHCAAHSEGEIATVEAVNGSKLGMIASTMSTVT